MESDTPPQETPRSSASVKIAFALLFTIVLIVGFYLKLADSSRTRQSNGPVSVDEAQLVLNVRLPVTAHEVQYLQWSDGVGVLDIVRFQAPLDDCLAFAKDVSQRFRAQGVRDLDASGNDLGRSSLDISPMSAPWFDPQSIAKGFVAGEEYSHKPRIWIDSDREEVFYLYTD